MQTAVTYGYVTR